MLIPRVFSGNPTVNGNIDATGTLATFSNGPLIMTNNPTDGSSLLSYIKGSAGLNSIRRLSAQNLASTISFNSQTPTTALMATLAFDTYGALFVQSTACSLFKFPSISATSAAVNFAGASQVSIFILLFYFIFANPNFFLHFLLLLLGLVPPPLVFFFNQIAGSGLCVSDVLGKSDGVGASVGLGRIFAADVDVSGNLFIAETGDTQSTSWLRKVSVSTRTATTIYNYNSPVAVYLGQSVCSGVVLDNNGVLYFADSASVCTIAGCPPIALFRMQYGSGSTTPILVAGGSTTCITSSIAYPSAYDGIGAGAAFSSQLGRMVIDNTGKSLYIVDIGCRSIRRLILSTTEVITLFADPAVAFMGIRFATVMASQFLLFSSNNVIMQLFLNVSSPCSAGYFGISSCSICPIGSFCVSGIHVH